MRLNISSFVRQTLSEFFAPLNKKHRRKKITIAFLISIVLYVVVNIGLAEVIHQNTFRIHMLAAELIIEHGPELNIESSGHAKMVQLYVDHLEEGYIAKIVGLLYPTYSPDRVLSSLAPALDIAATADNEEIPKKAIWQAGLAIDKLYMISEKFPRSPIKWFNSENLSEELIVDVNDAIEISANKVGELETNPDRNTAIAACRANRRAILLLALYRLGYEDKEKIESFRNTVEKAHNIITDIAQNEPDGNERDFLYSIAGSELRRVNILNALIDNDIERACEILRKAIEKTYEERKVELSS